MEEVIVRINPKTLERTIAINGVEGGACTSITAALIENNEQLDYQYTEEYCIPDELPDYAEDMVGSGED